MRQKNVTVEKCTCTKRYAQTNDVSWTAFCAIFRNKTW